MSYTFYEHDFSSIFFHVIFMLDNLYIVVYKIFLGCYLVPLQTQLYGTEFQLDVAVL